jgi:class 3 adenylate cyclase
VKLAVRTGPRAGETIDVGSELLIGRTQADVVIEDPKLSRHHALVRPARAGLEITDLHSLNGTMVDGQRITGPVQLAGGECIEVGDTTLEAVADVPEGEATVLSSRVGRLILSSETERVLATVMFTDIVDSTVNALELGDAAWKRLLDRHDELSSDTVQKFGGRVVERTGDGVLATFVAPGRALRCADMLRAAVHELGVVIRTGIHTGEVELRHGAVSGIGVHIAARVNAHATGDEILVSRTVRDLVAGSACSFTSRGSHRLKGLPGRWELYALSTIDPD